MFNTRIRVPETATVGEIVEIRAMIMHPMDNGYSYSTQGELIPVNIISTFTCRYMGEEVLHVALEPGLSANPIFTFQLRAEASGPVEFTWIDQNGEVTTGEALIEVIG